MATPEEIADAIGANATGPKQVVSDGVSVTQHPIKDQIDAAKFVGAKEAVKKKGFGIRYAQFVPPGGD